MSDAIWPTDTQFLRGPEDGVSWVRLDFALSRIAELEAALAERDRMLQVAYENDDFDGPLTLDEYKADLLEDADARDQYLRARAEEGSGS